jgi:hypothetical protein
MRRPRPSSRWRAKPQFEARRSNLTGTVAVGQFLTRTLFQEPAFCGHSRPEGSPSPGFAYV